MIYFDLETSGLDHHAGHQIIQIAAYSLVTSEPESFECKLDFNRELADPKALEINSYDPETWRKQSVAHQHGLSLFSRFMKRHANITKTSRAGNNYKVCKLAGHNISGFDLDFLRAAFRAHDMFLPADFHGLDTMSLAAWLQKKGRISPENLKLQTLAKYFDIVASDAHDALDDVMVNAEVGTRLMEFL